MEIQDSCPNLVVSAGTLMLIIFPWCFRTLITAQRNTATWPAQQFTVLQNSSSWMQRGRVSSKSITLNGSNTQSPSEKDPSKELMDQRFITDSAQATFNRAGKNSQKCCGILNERSLGTPVKTSMFCSMTFMVFYVIKTGKHLEKMIRKSHCCDTYNQIISPN